MVEQQKTPFKLPD
jgi:hypothetical protein